MELDDPYGELGLTEEASDTEVKAAWRRLSARWHPDRNASPQALQRIQRINLALEEIRSARQRAQDEHAAADDDGIELTISLSLEEAACGCIRTVQGEIAHACADCQGSGAAPEQVPCAQCAGRGNAPASLWFPWLATPAACAACEGRGSVEAPCPSCEGSGQAAPLAYRSRLRIPPGVRDGHQLQARVKVKGRDGLQSLHVRVRLQAHEFMALQDDGTIQLELPVDGFAWIAGRWIDVPTPHGLRQMRLQRGALTYRMREAGFPVSPSGTRADCIVSVVPLFPEQWSAQQETLVDALIQANSADESTAAGAKAQEWSRKVAAWRQRQAPTPASD